MSQNLMLLLERINAKSEPLKPMTEEEMAEQDAKVSLIVRRVENRRSLEEAKNWTLETIVSIKEDLRLINHVLKCHQCMAELILDVERYGGSHSGISSLDLCNNEILEFYLDSDDEAFVEDFEGSLNHELISLWRQIPRAKNYRIGNYWLQLEGETDFETEKFIRDRLEWHRKMLLYQLKEAREYYRMLLRWNVDDDPPLGYQRVI